MSQQKVEETFGVRTKLSYCKVFPGKFVSNRIKKNETFMNKPVHLGLSISKLSKITMHNFWYDYIKPKYRNTVNKQNCVSLYT